MPAKTVAALGGPEAVKRLIEATSGAKTKPIKKGGSYAEGGLPAAAGDQDLPYRDLSRTSFGKIGDQPVDNERFGPLAVSAQSAPAPIPPASPMSLASLLDKPAALARGVGESVLGNVARVGAHITDGSKNLLADAAGYDRPNRFADIEAANGLSKSGADALRGITPSLDSLVEAAGWTPKATQTPAQAASAAGTPADTPAATPSSAAEKPPARTLPDGFSLGKSSVPGVTRINGGKSPLFTNIDPATAVGEMKGNTIGVVPAGASPFGSTTGVSAALQDAADRGDWAAVKAHYQKSGGTFNGEAGGTPGGLLGSLAGSPSLEEMRDADRQKERQSFDNFVNKSTLATGLRDAVRSGGATNVAAAAGALTNFQNAADRPDEAQAERQNRMAIAQGNNLASLLTTEMQTRNQKPLLGAQADHYRLQSLLAGNQISSAQQLQALQKQYMEEADPVKQAELGRKLLMLQGKDPRQLHDEALKARSTLVGDLAKAYSSSPIPPLGPDGKTPLTMEQYIQQGLAQAAGTPAAGNQVKPQTGQAVAVGQVVGGYKFKGGDPNKATSWEAAQ